MKQWFLDAKLGIFIHWGIYAVDGTRESWSFFHGETSYAEYLSQLGGFTAARYDPLAWADLFARAEARYVVLTAKHHDGVALWSTQQSDLNVVRQTPARRDLLAPYCAALRERDLRVGLYFSHLDWSHPDYAPIPPEQRTITTLDIETFRQAWPEGRATPAWQRFLRFHDAQIQELCSKYAPDLLWFDGDWTPDDAFWEMPALRDRLHRWLPEVVLNSRLRGCGDYATPEQGLPIVPPTGPWEFCMTMNDSWGYRPSDHNYKSTRQIVRAFAECIGMGGNLLLDVGPMADGTIPSEQVVRLEALGAWIRHHDEAIFGTVAGLPAGHVYGSSTLSADSQTIYVFLFDRPYDEVAVKGIRTEVRSVSILGTGRQVPYRWLGGEWSDEVHGVLWIAVPEGDLDPYATVLKIELAGPLCLYRGQGRS
jgi:alpha-L-fucosidase